MAHLFAQEQGELRIPVCLAFTFTFSSCRTVIEIPDNSRKQLEGHASVTIAMSSSRGSDSEGQYQQVEYAEEPRIRRPSASGSVGRMQCHWTSVWKEHGSAARFSIAMAVSNKVRRTAQKKCGADRVKMARWRQAATALYITATVEVDDIRQRGR